MRIMSQWTYLSWTSPGSSPYSGVQVLIRSLPMTASCCSRCVTPSGLLWGLYDCHPLTISPSLILLNPVPLFLSPHILPFGLWSPTGAFLKFSQPPKTYLLIWLFIDSVSALLILWLFLLHGWVFCALAFWIFILPSVLVMGLIQIPAAWSLGLGLFGSFEILRPFIGHQIGLNLGKAVWGNPGSKGHA